MRSGKVHEFMTLLRAYYAAIPYDLEEETPSNSPNGGEKNPPLLEGIGEAFIS